MRDYHVHIWTVRTHSEFAAMRHVTCWQAIYIPETYLRRHTHALCPPTARSANVPHYTNLQPRLMYNVGGPAVNRSNHIPSARSPLTCPLILSRTHHPMPIPSVLTTCMAAGGPAANGTTHIQSILFTSKCPLIRSKTHHLMRIHSVSMTCMAQILELNLSA